MRREKKERTEIDMIAFEVLLPPGLIELKHGAVPSVAARIDVALDARSIVEPSDSAVIDIGPGGFREPEEVVQHNNLLLQGLHLDLLEPPGPRGGENILLELLSHALPLPNLPRNQRTRLLQHLLVTTKPTVPDVLLASTAASELVVGLGVLGNDVLVGEGKDPVALLPVLVSSLVEEDAERSLSILGLLSLRCERNAQDSGYRSTDISSRVSLVNDPHHGGTGAEALGRTLDPVNGGVLDIVLLEDGEDGRVGIAAGFLGRGTGEHGDPDNDLLLKDRIALIVGSRELNRNHGRDVNVEVLAFKEAHDGGANVVPPHVWSEDRVGSAMGSPIGNGSVLIFGSGKDKGTFMNIRAVQEGGVVLGNTLVEESLFEGRGEVWVDDSGVGKHGDGSRVARWRPWGRRRTCMESRMVTE